MTDSDHYLEALKIFGILCLALRMARQRGKQVSWGRIALGVFTILGGLYLALSLVTKSRATTPRPRTNQPTSQTESSTPRPTPSTPASLPTSVALTTSVQIPVSIGGRPSGTVTLQPGTRLVIVSAGRDSVVVKYAGGTANILKSATDYPRPNGL
jgi:hypothetical protein